MRTALLEVVWSDILDNKQPEEAFNAFFDVVNGLFNDFFPLHVKQPRATSDTVKHRPLKTDKPWFNAELARLKSFILTFRDLSRNAADDITRDHFFSLYIRAKKQYRLKIDVAKKAANVQLIENSLNPCKALWNLVNNSRNSTRPPTSKCAASPDEFNEFLISNVSAIANSFRNNDDRAADLVVDQETSFNHWRGTTPDGLVKLVNQLKASHSPDIYGMSSVFIKSIIDVIAAPLSRVINMCLRAGVFPHSLKLSRTVPIFKKGDPSDMSSYRPISIIPMFAKIMESVLKSQIVSYFERNQMFSELQHGFRQGRSTTSAVADITRRIYEAYEATDSVALTLCDLSKAFDCVPHQILLKKLQRYGVRGSALQMFASYFENRHQVLSISGAESQPLRVDHGVPQGSVLGPVLFLVAINDLDLDGKALRFADDTTLIATAKDPTAARDMSELLFCEAREWLVLNKLKLNEEKTQKLICSLSPSLAQETSSVKLLGFVIDTKLTWSEHIESVCKKLARLIFLLRKLTKLVDESYLLAVYYALFHSHINYGIQLWGHSPNCSKVLLLQKKAVRILTGSGRLEHCKPLFVDTGILTVYSSYILSCVCFVQANLDKFLVRGQVHQHNTRHKCKLDIPRCRLSKTKDSSTVMAIKLYNKLPDSVKQLEGSKFNSLLKSWLKTKPFYSLQEFFEDDCSGLSNCGH